MFVDDGARTTKKARHGAAGVDIGREMDRLVRKLVPREEIRLTRIRTAWPRIATPRVARRTWPARFRGHRLVVYVHDNQWLHELSYLRQAMTERVREIEGAGPPTDVDPELVLEFRIGRIPPEVAVEPPPPPAPRGPPLPLNPPPETLEAMHRIADPELREAIAAARYILGGGAQ